MITGENTRQEDVPEGAWFLPFLSEAGQTDLRRICGTNMKQEFYYQQMNKAQQNAYRAMLDGFESLSPEFPVLRLDGKENKRDENSPGVQDKPAGPAGRGNGAGGKGKVRA